MQIHTKRIENSFASIDVIIMRCALVFVETGIQESKIVGLGRSI